MAAAILVLAVVAGALVLIFRDQSPSPSAALGNPATPTATPATGLPTTVSTHGISVTLQLVDSTSSATRFHVSIKLPKYAVEQPHDFILGQAPATNVQLAGMNAESSQLQAFDFSTSSVSDDLQLQYPAPFPANRTVTLTIDQLWLPDKPPSPLASPTDWNTFTPTPVHMHAVDGPWTLRVTPDMVATQPLPTYQSDWYCEDDAVSPAPKVDCYPPMGRPLAERLVNFRIIEPNPLVPPLSRDPFTVGVDRFGAPRSNPPNYVNLTYWTSQKSPQQEVQLVETTNPAAVPNVNGDSASITTPLTAGGPPQTLAILPGSVATTVIQRVSVTQFDVGGGQFPTRYYVWTQAGIGSYLAYTVEPPSSKPLLSGAEMRQLVTSIIQQRAGRATPGPTPLASP